eukprot:scaffold20663_cov184-Skeletonema_dohrnii-CCMP3373.AAC.3
MLTAVVAGGVVAASEPSGEGAVDCNVSFLVTLVMILTAVEVNIISICSSFVEIQIFDADFDRATHFLTPSRVELIGKRSILCLETTTNR